MPEPLIRLFEDIDDSHASAVGGKGLNLGLMIRAGLPIPRGFCVTSHAYRIARGRASQAGPVLDEALRAEVLLAYDQLGRGMVAVRSSATDEDGSAASFAGQQETILGVEGESQLVDAVERCWRSLDSERARAYRRKQNVEENSAAMAVVVQRLVPSEASGVLFTHDPLDPAGERMLVESALGLGEMVVSGRVMPDRFHIDRATGRLVDQQIHVQSVMLTAEGERPVDAETGSRASLSPQQLEQLAELGRRIEAYYGEPRDVEWAWAEGEFRILQSRPITTAATADREAVRKEEIAALAARAEPAGTVWARYNLAEVLPDPTPMTWMIVRRFMSGRGGFGCMYRDLGFDPDPILDDEGFFDLVCGRPYVNLSREPKLYFRDFPFGHDFKALKEHPEKAIYPTPTVGGAKTTGRFWWRLPSIVFRMLRNSKRLSNVGLEDAVRLRTEIFPTFAIEVREEAEIDLTKLSPAELIERLERNIRRTLVDFSRQSLRPSTYAAVAIAELEKRLAATMGEEPAATTVRELVMGVRPDEGTDLAGALRELSEGRLSEEDFLKNFGHRGSHEMELSRPRWREAPESLPKSHEPSRVASRHTTTMYESARDESSAKARWGEVAAAAKLDAASRKACEAALERAQTYLALRESAKHYFMLGYEQIRRVLVELDRRFGLNGGIFYLEPSELPRLVAEESFADTIARRKQRRALALSFAVPQVLFSDDLEAIGRPLPADGAAEWKGTPVSFGTFEGPALVLEEPQPIESLQQGIKEGYVLVCPSTDPAWVPLFLHAGALVMETGGILSHGAIVAREFGLPAVVGIADVHRRVRTGQRLRVDGSSGVVHVFE